MLALWLSLVSLWYFVSGSPLNTVRCARWCWLSNGNNLNELNVGGVLCIGGQHWRRCATWKTDAAPQSEAQDKRWERQATQHTESETAWKDSRRRAWVFVWNDNTPLHQGGTWAKPSSVFDCKMYTFSQLVVRVKGIVVADTQRATDMDGCWLVSCVCLCLCVSHGIRQCGATRGTGCCFVSLFHCFAMPCDGIRLGWHALSVAHSAHTQMWATVDGWLALIETVRHRKKGIVRIRHNVLCISCIPVQCATTHCWAMPPHAHMSDWKHSFGVRFASSWKSVHTSNGG